MMNNKSHALKDCKHCVICALLIDFIKGVFRHIFFLSFFLGCHSKRLLCQSARVFEGFGVHFLVSDVDVDVDVDSGLDWGVLVLFFLSSCSLSYFCFCKSPSKSSTSSSTPFCFWCLVSSSSESDQSDLRGIAFQWVCILHNILGTSGTDQTRLPLVE